MAVNQPAHGIDLRPSPSEQAFRDEVRTWLQAHVPTEPLASGDTAEGFAQHLEWERKLYADRWAVVSWPRAYGGRDATLWEWLIFEEEYYRADAPARVTQNGIFLLAPTLFDFGTQEQRDRILPKMASAEQVWAQGWSEPEAGSDLAAVRGRATRVRGGFRVSGQKTWTTRGAYCTHLFGLFRSDPDSVRHHGLTYLMLPLNAPGVSVRPFARLDGDEGFAEVFLDEVFVPDHDVIGEVGQGWKVAMATTGSERGLTLRSPGRFQRSVERLIELAQANPETVSDSIRERIAEVWMEAEAYHLFTLREVSELIEGRQAGPRSSLNKVFWSELDLRIHQIACDILGPNSALDSEWVRGWMFSLGGTIYAGTNEIQRNIIAERILGLPRK